eukprot:5028352-Lingulodinium_polyedra.AAC.1
MPELECRLAERWLCAEAAGCSGGSCCCAFPGVQQFAMLQQFINSTSSAACIAALAECCAAQ